MCKIIAIVNQKGGVAKTTTTGLIFFVGNDDLGKLERMLTGWRDSEYTLQTCLSPLREKYDYIIIDCMPSVGNLTENAIIAAD